MLYVGKAKNLRNRINSYTRVTPQQPKTYKLVTSAHSINYKVLESEFVALLTEASLIKAHQPPYNILLKDDKTPLYIIITQESYPRVKTARKKQLFTIYSNLPKSNVFGPFSSAKDVRTIIKSARRVFKFCQASPKQKGKPCFYTHLNLCSGACIQKINTQDYSQMISQLKLFLSGKKKTLAKQLTQQMKIHSQNKHFEKAANVRDQLQSIQQLYTQRRSLIQDDPLPTLAQDTNQDKLIKTSHLLHQIGVVPDKYQLKRIEAYDISNTSGQNSTASMVVFIDGQPATDEYRHFKIKYTTGPNDPAMLKEALTRRLNNPQWDYPQLIVIDGGKGQLKAALSITQNKIPTVSIAKRPDRLMSFQQNKYLSIPLKAGHPITNLIAHLRDESHRFAKNYHKYLRRQSLTSS